MISEVLNSGLTNLRNGVGLNSARLSMAIADVLKLKIEGRVKGLSLRCRRSSDKSVTIGGEMATDDLDKTSDDVRSVVTELLSNKTNVTDSVNGLR